MAKKIRVLVAKVGCDIHERGALTMLNVFRDAGMEVIYTGRFQSEEGVVNAAVAENVDVICVSDLTGSLTIICRKILEGLKANDAADIKLICGGIITADDEAEFKKMGVDGWFGTGTDPQVTVQYVRELVK
jgi:methylmalonyl-CoA mutase C-terminal domain/subunit